MTDQPQTEPEKKVDHTTESPKQENIKLTEEQNKRLEFHMSAPLRSANRLMEQLYKDDHFYETATYAWVGEKDAKKLFLYGVCKEVLKVCIALMNDKEILQELPSTELDRIGKIVNGSLSDTQTYRIRKMVELLALLILFDRNTKKDEEYRIFLSAENLDLALSRQQDFSDLYEKRIISNTQHSIDDFAGRIAQDFKTLGISEIWFLDKDRLVDLRPSVFKGKKKFYMDALLVATPDERVGLGISYGRGYSRTSQAIHPLLGSHDYGKDDNDIEHVFANFSYLSILCMDVMHLAYKLAGIDDPEGLAKIMGENFEKSHSSKIIAALQKQFAKGDLVLTAWGDLAEVIDQYTSKYGYTAYQIKFLSRPPIPDYPEDWIESQSITARLMTKGMVRAFYEKHSQKLPKEVVDIWPEIMKQPDEFLMESAKGFFVDMHKHGILIPMLMESGFLKPREKLSFFDEEKTPEPPLAAAA